MVLGYLRLQLVGEFRAHKHKCDSESSDENNAQHIFSIRSHSVLFLVGKAAQSGIIELEKLFTNVCPLNFGLLKAVEQMGD